MLLQPTVPGLSAMLQTIYETESCFSSDTGLSGRERPLELLTQGRGSAVPDAGTYRWGRGGGAGGGGRVEVWEGEGEVGVCSGELSFCMLRPRTSRAAVPRAESLSGGDYVKLLDSAYGVVEDGDEIFARFLNTNQNAGEKSSD